MGAVSRHPAVAEGQGGLKTKVGTGDEGLGHRSSHISGSALNDQFDPRPSTSTLDPRLPTLDEDLMTSPLRAAALVFLAALIAAPPLTAQGLLDRPKKRAEQKAKQKAEQTKGPSGESDPFHPGTASPD